MSQVIHPSSLYMYVYVIYTQPHRSIHITIENIGQSLTVYQGLCRLFTSEMPRCLRGGSKGGGRRCLLNRGVWAFTDNTVSVSIV